MSSNDSSSDLDSRIAAIVESTVGRMRDELMQRMVDNESRLRDVTRRLEGESAAPPAAAIPEPAPAARDTISDLFAAAVTIDRGGSQQDILAAMLEGVGRFAGRSALFLTRADGAQGWGSYGFEEAAGDIQEVLLSYAEGPLAILAEGRGCVNLSADECGELCGRMGVTPGAEGLLVPFVLRDRLAAALYVDRFADGEPLERQPLQLLAYIGAQAVEGLALRERSETPTLQVAAEAATAPGVALWTGPAAEPEVVEPAVAETPVAETPTTEPAITERPAAEISAPEPSFVLPSEIEPQPVEPLPAPPPEAAATPSDEVAIGELAGEETPGPLVTAAPTTTEPETATGFDSEWELPAVSLDEPLAAPEETAPEPIPQLETPAELTPGEPSDQPPPMVESGAGLSTPEVEPAAAFEPPAPAEMTPPPSDPIAGGAGETTEVRPPSDVSGPGWAFTASQDAADAGDDAQHEEARRLARLLVTEIKLYNEEQVEEGRRGNDIYARLREDIDRSRQIFNERVDDSIRQETDYFQDEMVRILAGGNAEALGL